MAAPLSKKVRTLLASGDAPGWALTLARQRQEKLSRWRKEGVPFLVGQRAVFLPNFTITMLRVPQLPSSWASFKVPLNFNKLDLRDYLWHAYSVKTHAIRSHVRIFPIQQVARGSARSLPGKKKYFRPQSEKRMTVQLDRPFVWPAAPQAADELEAWDNKRYRRLEDMQRRQALGEDAGDNKDHKAHRKALRDRAEALLAGRERWVAIDLSPSAGVSGSSQSLPLR